MGYHGWLSTAATHTVLGHGKVPGWAPRLASVELAARSFGPQGIHFLISGCLCYRFHLFDRALYLEGWFTERH